MVRVLTSIGRAGEKKLHSLALSVRVGHVRGHSVQPAATKRRSLCRVRCRAVGLKRLRTRNIKFYAMRVTYACYKFP